MRNMMPKPIAAAAAAATAAATVLLAAACGSGQGGGGTTQSGTAARTTQSGTAARTTQSGTAAGTTQSGTAARTTQSGTAAGTAQSGTAARNCLVFAVSGREDSPAPTMSASMQSAAARAVHDGAWIGLVSLDGRPRLILSGAFKDPGVNSEAWQRDEEHFLGSLQSALQRVRATSPHADVLRGLDVAGDAIRAHCQRGGSIYLEDSGLQETGQVDFRQPSMLNASPADVASFLTHKHDLPHVHGITVVLVGLGDTAPPQHQLSISQQDNVVAIWSAIAEAGGATVRTDPTPLSGPAPTHVPPVLLVPVPPDQPWSPSDPTIKFPDSGPVGFKPDTATFRDPAAAARELQKLAAYLTATPSARIKLTGTTAHWGPLHDARLLAKRRAEEVKVTLIRLGASPSQIPIVRGVAWHFPGYVNDQAPGGALLPGPAEHNRSVIVTRLSAS